jgi:hypothetical protein
MPLAALAICLSSAAVHAQIGTLWSMQDLHAKADLVVVAEFVKTTDTGRKVAHPGLKPGFPMVEMQSEFRVALVMKGDVTPVALMHYRHDMDQWRLDHPQEPGKPPQGVVNAGSALSFSAGREQYLMFLKRLPDGRYEPLSGHVFPTDSVFVLGKLK